MPEPSAADAEALHAAFEALHPDLSDRHEGSEGSEEPEEPDGDVDTAPPTEGAGSDQSPPPPDPLSARLAPRRVAGSLKRRLAERRSSLEAERAEIHHAPVTPPRPREPGIHQFVPNLYAGDAVGGHTRRLRDALVARNIPSRIYVQITEPETEAETDLFTSYEEQSHPDDVLVYQFATASHLASWLTSRSETLAVNYHNVTPAEIYAPWDPHIADIQEQAQEELSLMAPRTALAIAVSSLNEADLTAAGFAATAVVPPIAGATLEFPPHGERRFPIEPGARWLCLGRLAPNKAFEDAIKGLAVSRKHYDPDATLTIVGKPAQEDYAEALRRFVWDLGLEEAVTFAGHVSDVALRAAYVDADVLVVPSLHEGFCVPLVEAMAARLPVVASRHGISSDVLGQAGIMVDTHNPLELAAAVDQLLRDEAIYNALAAAGEAQLQRLNMAGAGGRTADLLIDLLPEPS